MDEDGEEPRDETIRRLEMTAKILSLVYALISLMFLLWALIPEHRKRLMAMKVAKTIEQSAWRTAFRAGHQAMALELSGHGTNYELPYRLSQVADKAGKAYEKLRYTA